MASKVHRALADKHNLDYNPKPNYGEGADWEDRKEWSKVQAGPYDSKYQSYKFALKSEEELSKAIGDIKPGKLMGVDGKNRVYDYSHVLHPEHYQAGYRLRIEDDGGGKMSTYLYHPSVKLKGMPIGLIDGDFDHGNKSIDPGLADLHPQHQGKGLGQAMYTAFFAHGKHIKGAQSVSGGEHSTMASKVHQKLSQLHGLNYQPVANPQKTDKPAGQYDAKFAPYSYALKFDEFDKSVEEWSAKRGLKSGV